MQSHLMPGRPLQASVEGVQAGAVNAVTNFKSSVTGVIDGVKQEVATEVGRAQESFVSSLPRPSAAAQERISAVRPVVSFHRRPDYPCFYCNRSHPASSQLVRQLQVTTSVSEAKAQFDEAPAGYTLLALLVLSGAAFAYWKLELSGFKGTYTPLELLLALNKEDNIVVVDVRQDDEVEDEGILELTRTARGKAVALPVCPVCAPGSLPHLRLGGLSQRKDIITKHQYALYVIRDSTVIPRISLSPSTH